MAKKKKKSKITLNVQIPIMLHEQFKAYAKAQGEPMRFFVQQDIKARLSVQVKSRRKRLSIGTTAGSTTPEEIEQFKRQHIKSADVIVTPVFGREYIEYKERQKDNCLIEDLNKI